MSETDGTDTVDANEADDATAGADGAAAIADADDSDRGESADASSVSVTVYTREDCSLCVAARETIEETAADLGVAIDLDMVDVDEDPELAAEYGERVPYVLIDGHPAFKYEVDERQLRLKLLAAS